MPADEPIVLRWIAIGALLLTAACSSAEARLTTYPADAVINEGVINDFVEDFGSGGFGDGFMKIDDDPAFEVLLSPDSLALADAMVDHFGDRIEVQVGEWPYPMPEGVVSRCGEAMVNRERPAGLDVRIELTSTVIGQGDQIAGQVIISNTTEVDSDAYLPMTAVPSIVDPGTSQVRNLDSGFMKQVGGPMAGGSIELPLRAELATCDPADGYRVPPGEYEIVFMGAVAPITIEAES